MAADRPMVSAKDVAFGILRGADDTPEARAAVELVLSAAQEAADGAMPLDVALGATTYRTRCLAALCGVTDPRYPALMALVDHSIRKSGAVTTKHGLFTPEDIGSAGGRKTYAVDDDGVYREVLAFPDIGGYFRREEDKPTRHKPKARDEAELARPWWDRLEEGE